MKDKFTSDKFKIITVHTPEFEHEKKTSLLKQKIEYFKVDYPVFIDNDRTYWKAIHSDGWPSIYLVDKSGKIRFIYLGETHRYFAQARAIEKNINELLAE